MKQYITDVAERATQGLWVPDSGVVTIEDQVQQLMVAAGTDREWQAVGICDAEGFAEVTCMAHPCNAAWIAHWVNRGPEMLAALREMKQLLMDPNAEAEDADKALLSLCKVIDNASHVEVP